MFIQFPFNNFINSNFFFIKTDFYLNYAQWIFCQLRLLPRNVIAFICLTLTHYDCYCNLYFLSNYYSATHHYLRMLSQVVIVTGWVDLEEKHTTCFVWCCLGIKCGTCKLVTRHHTHCPTKPLSIHSFHFCVKFICFHN